MGPRQIIAAVSVIAAAPRAACADHDVSIFLCARQRLFGIAYRMLGDVAEAEDIVQEVWVRWQTTDRSRIRNPPGFLVAGMRRLAINVLKLALMLLEKLSQTERAAYVLREAFS